MNKITIEVIAERRFDGYFIKYDNILMGYYETLIDVKRAIKRFEDNCKYKLMFLNM